MVQRGTRVINKGSTLKKRRGPLLCAHQVWVGTISRPILGLGVQIIQRAESRASGWNCLLPLIYPVVVCVVMSRLI